ncbi:UDP-N-acetylmuramoyl-L-alanyl-D-glutamate--2,6-diaminopimelate ligase [Candidatus Ichthyocystis sparus]|uniref:UDP-N-acetylmuramoyl-L-alanyl-D-glutamate--2, 6-diaminopimelate ligase n=1 Tax=Candidatus Ichthyocystis sparus TaxID=1561004 RepID=UPI000B0D3F26|nr:UDP-N-acetylmuramoyl-L-alanyl-D-glutamate--2,6-diaminopimelate ligase [Candidatus Ichthyocystis sparus]
MSVHIIFEQLLFQGVSSVRRLVTDSREVRAGDVFLAYPGLVFDGRCYLREAIGQGCFAVIYENVDGFVWPRGLVCPNVGHPNIVSSLGEIACHVYNNPSSRMNITAVTGTDGKTTVVSWLAFLYGKCGYRGASIGTLGWGYPGRLFPHGLTTPNAVTLHDYLSDFEKQGITHVALEASSIGLEQDRLQCIDIDVAVLTNLHTDHMDYHKNRDNYARSKELLFKRDFDCAVINSDDPFGQYLLSSHHVCNKERVTFGLDPMFDHDISASEVVINDAGIRCKISIFGEATPIVLPIRGQHNLYNFLAVLSTMVAHGLSWENIFPHVVNLPSLPGRFEPVHQDTDDCLVWVDYAHTPGAMSAVLKMVRGWLRDDQRLICIFGCGGERDRSKRSQMGLIACSLADKVVITEDNPRGEDSGQIIFDILSGCNIKDSSVSVIPDRHDAIVNTILSADIGDAVIIMGKGHENYQEIASVRYPFSDQVVALKALRERNNL